MADNKWKESLSRTKRAAFGRVARLLGTTELNPHFWEQLESILIQADLGVANATDLIAELQGEANKEGLTNGEQIHTVLRSMLLERLIPFSLETTENEPLVIMLVGVNGSGKTTTAARLAYRFKSQGLKCMLAAADTFRAAASEQLELWAKQLEVDFVGGHPGADPGSVAYDATQAAVVRGLDVLIIDTSGRMHTHHNLMAELKKVCRVPQKILPNAPHQILLVLDATTGQNGIAQASAFASSIKITGVVLAKLDTSAKGGVGFNVASKLGLPLAYAGIGESEKDLVEFVPEAFVDALLTPA